VNAGDGQRPAAPPSDKTVRLPDSQEARPIPETQPDVAKPQTATREIHFQLQHETQRVDLRLTERQGQVHISVRTPDERLSGVLRDNLPSLSTRLEDSGFHTWTWHPGLATEPESSRPSLTGSGVSPDGGDPQKHPQENQQGQPDQQERPSRQKPGPEGKQRKEFSWLFQSLQ
jgi:hypothetical protein